MNGERSAGARLRMLRRRERAEEKTQRREEKKGEKESLVEVSFKDFKLSVCAHLLLNL